jgi:hypothetical protein
VPIGGRRTYWFACSDAPEGDQELDLTRFRSWQSPLAGLIEATLLLVTYGYWAVLVDRGPREQTTPGGSGGAVLPKPGETMLIANVISGGATHHPAIGLVILASRSA